MARRLLDETGASGHVETVRRSPALIEEEQQVCASYERFGPFLEKEVQARQVGQPARQRETCPAGA